MNIESFTAGPLTATLPSYLYAQYADDPDLPAFITAFNGLSQGYLDWFNNAPLSVYTSPYITGKLLDWIGAGIYGIPRPTLSTETQSNIAGYDVAPYDTAPLNDLTHTQTGTATVASDDAYKRIITWNLYRGDGDIFTLQWLKNRVARFVNGAGGRDTDVLSAPPSVSIAAPIFTVTYPASTAYSLLQLAYANGFLPVPFQYSLAFKT